MSDLVEYLRKRNPRLDPDCHEAADEIERLRDRVARLGANWKNTNRVLAAKMARIDVYEDMYPHLAELEIK